MNGTRLSHTVADWLAAAFVGVLAGVGAAAATVASWALVNAAGGPVPVLMLGAALGAVFGIRRLPTWQAQRERRRP